MVRNTSTASFNFVKPFAVNCTRHIEETVLFSPRAHRQTADCYTWIRAENCILYILYKKKNPFCTFTKVHPCAAHIGLPARYKYVYAVLFNTLGERVLRGNSRCSAKRRRKNNPNRVKTVSIKFVLTQKCHFIRLNVCINRKQMYWRAKWRVWFFEQMSRTKREKKIKIVSDFYSIHVQGTTLLYNVRFEYGKSKRARDKTNTPGDASNDEIGFRV